MKLFFALLVLIAVSVCILLRQRGRAAQAEPPERRQQLTETSFHAVSIRTQVNACAAARELSGQRFLSDSAPQLPLPDCDAANCECVFTHHKDRRSGQDRRSPFATPGYGSGTGSFKQERRERRDRRNDTDAN